MRETREQGFQHSQWMFYYHNIQWKSIIKPVLTNRNKHNLLLHILFVIISCLSNCNVVMDRFLNWSQLVCLRRERRGGKKKKVECTVFLKLSPQCLCYLSKRWVDFQVVFTGYIVFPHELNLTWKKWRPDPLKLRYPNQFSFWLKLSYPYKKRVCERSEEVSRDFQSQRVKINLVVRDGWQCEGHSTLCVWPWCRPPPWEKMEMKGLKVDVWSMISSPGLIIM